MGKIVYNDCYGGFSLSHEAIMRYAELKSLDLIFEPINGARTRTMLNGKSLMAYKVNGEHFNPRLIPRADPALVQVVEELGEAANGSFANLKIRKLSSGMSYRIDEYDGAEVVIGQSEDEWEIAP